MGSEGALASVASCALLILAIQSEGSSINIVKMYAEFKGSRVALRSLAPASPLLRHPCHFAVRRAT